MCGIIGAFSTKNKAVVNSLVVDQYQHQYARGQRGFGVVGIDKHKKIVVKRACEPTKFMFDLHHKNFPFMIAHHRMPTSSENILSQTHPIHVSNPGLDYDYLVVHNGVIGNTEELKKKHEELGFQYSTEHYVENYSKTVTCKFNDSECLAIEIARFLDGDEKIIGTRGAAAFIVLQIDKETHKVKKLHFGRNNTNPLNMYKTRGLLFLSSEGKGDNLTPDIMYSCSLEGEMELSRRTIEWAPVVAHSYQSKSGASQGASGAQSSQTSTTPGAFSPPANGTSSIPVPDYKPVQGFVAGGHRPTVVQTPSGVKYEPASPGSAILVPTGANKEILTKLASEQNALELPGPKLTDRDDDAEYQAWWLRKQAAEIARSSGNESGSGFLGTQREDLDAELDDFFEYLADGDTCPYLVIDDYLKTLRRHMESAHDEAMRIHNYCKTGDMTPEDIEYAHTLWD